MDALEFFQITKLVQVLADGLRRDSKMLGKTFDFDASVASGNFQNVDLPGLQKLQAAILHLSR